MATIPKNLKYTKEHEWTDIQDNIATVGITDFAQSSLGDIVFIELPTKGKMLKKDGTFGVVESIKSVSDLFSPLSGEVVDVNTNPINSPDQCNKDPYGSWLIKIKMSAPSEVNELLTAEKYENFCH